MSRLQILSLATLDLESGLSLDSPRKWPGPYAAESILPIGPRVHPSVNQSKRIPGKDRNEPCTCGCGRKRKKCPNGGLHTEHAEPQLSQEQYTKKVLVELESRGLDGTPYKTTHIESYFQDGVITCSRCADLVELMIEFDGAKYTNEAD